MTSPHPLRPTLGRAGVAALLAAAVALPLVGCQNQTPTAAPRDGSSADVRADSQRNGDSQFTADGKGALGVNAAKSGTGDLSVTKKMPEKIVLGKTMTYDVTVKNPSDGTLAGVVVNEELPDGFDFESSQPTARRSDDGKTLTFDMGDLAKGQTQQIKITGTPQKAGQLQACTTYEFSHGVCAMITVVNPSLRIVKTGPETAGLCQDVTYTYVVSNPGKDAATNVTLFDELPEGLSSGGNRKVNVNVGTVAAGQEVRKAITVQADRAGSFGSYALAKSQLEEVKSQNVATTFVAPKLAVDVRAGNPTQYLGKTGTFNVNVKNTGTVASPDTMLLLNLDGSGTVTGVRGDGLQNGSGAAGKALDIGALDAGQSRNYQVSVATTAAGRVRLNATAQSVCANREGALATAKADDAFEVQTLSALQVEVVDKVDPVQVGTNTVYEITIINEGSGPDKNLQITAELPEGLSYVGSEGATAVQANGKSLTMTPVAVLPAGEKVTWYVTAKADSAAGATKFTVKAKSEGVPDAVEEQEPTRLY